MSTWASIASLEPPRRTLDIGSVSEAPRKPGEPRKILATLLCPLGDTLLATPALYALRRHFPSAQIVGLTNRSNYGIVEGNPDLDALVQVNPPGAGLEWARVARVLYQLRREQFDMIVNFSTLGQVLTSISGGKNHIAFPMPRYWWLRSTNDEKFVGGHAVDRYLSVVNTVGVPELSDASERTPRLYLSGKDRAVARSILRQGGISPQDVVVTIHPGGEGFQRRKQWATDRFTAVARRLMEQYQAKIVIVGGPTDKSLAETIAAQLPIAPLDATGQATLKQTAALIEASTLFIGNDSCPLHMAGAVGTAAIGIFGPSNIQQFHPVGQPGFRFLAAHRDLPCSPCFHFVGNRPPWQVNLCYSRQCLKAISPEDVLASAHELLQTHAMQPAALEGC
ncbi:MAG TPA: glycosyltransferase family 9 protein [Ktedonobacterales bacterium]